MHIPTKGVETLPRVRLVTGYARQPTSIPFRYSIVNNDWTATLPNLVGHN